MKIAVMTGLPAKRYMDIDACQCFYELMNNFIPIPSAFGRGQG